MTYDEIDYFVKHAPDRSHFDKDWNWKDKNEEKAFNQKMQKALYPEKYKADKERDKNLYSLLDPFGVNQYFEKAVLHGFSQAAAGMASLYARIKGKDDISDKVIKDQQDRDEQFSKTVGDNYITDIGKLVGQTIPYAAAGPLGEAAKGTSLVESALSKIGIQKLKTSLGGHISKTLGRGLIGFGTGESAYNPNGDSDVTGELTAGINAFLPPAAKLLHKGISYVVPDWSYLKDIGAYFPKRFAKLLADTTTVSPKAIEKSLNVSGDQAPLAGVVLQIPELQKIEVNSLPNSLLSGQSKRLNELGQSLVNQATDLFNNLDNGLTSDTNKTGIVDFLQNAEIVAQNTKRKLYNKSNKSASDAGVKINLSNFSKVAKSLSESYKKVLSDLGINSSSKGMNLLDSVIENSSNKPEINQSDIPDWMKEKVSESVKSQLSKLTDRQPKSTSLETANYASSALDSLADIAKAHSDTSSLNIYRSLSKALDKDINESLKNYPNSVQDDYNIAQKFYKEEIVPFFNTKINKIVSGNADPDLIISNFMPKGEIGKGRTQLIKKLTDIAPNTKKPILTEIIKSAKESGLDGEDYISAGKFATILKNIGRDRFSILVDDDPTLMKKYDDFMTNMQNNFPALGRLQNQITGYQQIANESVKEIADALSKIATGELKGIPKYLFKMYGARKITAMLNDRTFLQRVAEEKIKSATSKNASTNDAVKKLFLALSGNLVAKAN